MEFSIKDIFRHIEKNIGIITAVFVVAIIGIIIVPMPTQLLDVLLVINISISVILILLTLFTSEILNLSVFPTLLLILTLFRLGLNISSTRLILGQGYAGTVIEAFGVFVTGNNYVVGAVIFLIIIIVQLVVITNGASRVSEVAARFTLDAMPGKQMAIDADLNAGIITEKEARQRRRDLQDEADFYGSMDGASKFVKGDAIAGVIITVINLIGGILIFVVMQGMDVMTALTTFATLTIGDGLVSQVPALLISISTGIIVTRSGSISNLGTQIPKQLFSNSRVLLIAAGILLTIGFIPGFPTLPFTVVALLIGVGGYLLLRNEKEKAKEEKLAKDKEKLKAQRADEKSKNVQEEDMKSFQVERIAIEIGYGLIPLVDQKSDDFLPTHIATIRKQCAQELGIVINPIRIRDNLQLSPNAYVIKIKGNVVADGEVFTDKFLVMDPGTTQFELQGIPTKEPAFGLDALWVDVSEKEKAELLGYTVVDPGTVLITHLKETIKQYSFELLGRQEVKTIVDNISEEYSVVVSELIPDMMTLGDVQKILQNLLKESVPIVDMVTILETLADYAGSIKDSELLTEYVRSALKRTITSQYVNHEGILEVVTIHPGIEELINNNIQKSFQGSFPALPPDVTTQVFASLGQLRDQLMMQGIHPVVLSAPRIRYAFRNMISLNYPHIPVLSLNEVPSDTEIEAVGMVKIDEN
jgi:flagellar biosynthesis protein FlhA